jgi:SAM-dependent methyltransferase
MMAVHAEVPTSSIAALYDRFPPAVEDALLATLKAFGRSVPAPRTDPYYGLDRLGGPTLRLVERMTAHGDFRKYVFVLDAGGGLGGIARWLTLTYGCRVLVLDVLPRLLATGRRLSRRARLDARVSAVAGSFEAVPVRDGTFTQIWSVGALQHAADRGAAIAELFRVLRPGSTLALHETVRRSEAVATIGGPWRHGTREEYLALLATTGFTTIECEDVSAEPDEPSAITRSAEETFLRALQDAAPDDAVRWNRDQRALDAVASTVRGPGYETVQLFARRPSV